MKVFLDTIGCRLNQAEIEIMARQFRSLGHQIVGAVEAADLAVVNTCSVTSQAAADSRSKLRRLARQGNAEIVATGCWATLHPAQAAAFPRVASVVPNAGKDRLVAGLLQLPERQPDLPPAARVLLPGPRRRTRSFIKVQDGCSNRCTFCVTPSPAVTVAAASRPRSSPTSTRPFAGGAKEVVLTGVHLGAWGREWGLRLKHLLRGLLRDTMCPASAFLRSSRGIWIRTSSNSGRTPGCALTSTCRSKAAAPPPFGAWPARPPRNPSRRSYPLLGSLSRALPSRPT